MTAALIGVLAALAAVIAAGGTIAWLALRLVDRGAKLADQTVATAAAKVATADEARERSVAVARAERIAADFEAYRGRAAVELTNLRADLERLRDAPHILDPDSRRAVWGRMLARVDAVPGLLDAARADGTAAAVGADAVRGVHGDGAAPGAAGRAPDRPGAGGAAA